MQYTKISDNSVVTSDTELQKLFSNISFGFPLTSDILSLIGYTASPDHVAPNPTYSINDQQMFLWNAAEDYQSDPLNGISGAGLAMLTLGVTMKLPLSLSVQNWIQTIWGLYFKSISNLVDNASALPVVDYSICGPMPTNLSAIIAEVYGAEVAARITNQEITSP